MGSPEIQGVEFADGHAPVGGEQPNISTGDDRMQQVVYVDGTLYGAVTTSTADGLRSGIAYWGIKPRWRGSTLDGKVRTEGTFSVAGNFVAYPSVALNGDGKGLIGFSLA